MRAIDHCPLTIYAEARRAKIKRIQLVCICETHEQAQRAMYNLQGVGIDMETLSIASRDTYSDLNDPEYYRVGEETFTIQKEQDLDRLLLRRDNLTFAQQLSREGVDLEVT